MRPGGDLVIASQCQEGVGHGHFAAYLARGLAHETPAGPDPPTTLSAGRSMAGPDFGQDSRPCARARSRGWAKRPADQVQRMRTVPRHFGTGRAVDGRTERLLDRSFARRAANPSPRKSKSRPRPKIADKKSIIAGPNNPGPRPAGLNCWRQRSFWAPNMQKGNLAHESNQAAWRSPPYQADRARGDD